MTEHTPHKSLISLASRVADSHVSGKPRTYPEYSGWEPAFVLMAEALRDAVRLEEQFETLRNFSESCCEIIERSRNPVEEISGRLDDVREIAYEGRNRAQV